MPLLNKHRSPLIRTHRHTWRTYRRTPMFDQLKNSRKLWLFGQPKWNLMNEPIRMKNPRDVNADDTSCMMDEITSWNKHDYDISKAKLLVFFFSPLLSSFAFHSRFESDSHTHTHTQTQTQGKSNQNEKSLWSNEINYSGHRFWRRSAASTATCKCIYERWNFPQTKAVPFAVDESGINWEIAMEMPWKLVVSIQIVHTHTHT